MGTDSPSILNATTVSIRAGNLQDGDKALIALAKRYAQLLDAAKENAELFEHLDFTPENSNQWQRLQRLEAKVNVEQVAGNLGPKLAAVLEQLGLSPAARVKAAKGGTTDVGGSAPGDALAALRAGHDELAARRSG